MFFKRSAAKGQSAAENDREIRSGAAKKLDSVQQLMRMAADNPSGLSRADVLRLQRIVGNRATQNLLRRTHRQGETIQRLLADGEDKLYVTKSWADTQFDDRSETVRQVLTEGKYRGLHDELIGNINEITGIDIYRVQEVDPVSKVTSTLLQDGFSTYPSRDDARKITSSQRQSTSTKLHNDLMTALDDRYKVTVLPQDGNKTNLSQVSVPTLPQKPLIDPKGLVKAPDDILGTFDITKVCALIAVYKGELNNLPGLYTQIGLTKAPKPHNGKAEQGYYLALHDYYYTQKNIQYDEPSTHAGIYREWGYQLIFTGNTDWTNLPTKLSQPLQTGKSYIFDLDNHSVYVTMKKTLNPGPALGKDERLSDYFNFQSDPNNFNTGEWKQRVENIYEK